MLALLTFASGRRAKFAVLAAWLAVAVVAGSLAGRFEEAQKNDPVSFLPGEAESVEALELIERFPSGPISPAVVVYHRDGGLTRADRARIAADRASLNRDPPAATRRVGPPVVARDGATALLVAPIVVDEDSDELIAATDDIRRRVSGERDGLVAKVTGAAGFTTDAVHVFESIDGTLLAATALLVFVLLILIYRSPLFWALPLLAVAIAEVTARALGYGIAEAGVTVNGQSAGILPVLVFGAGTDYALLLVARYREELRRRRDPHEAMRVALRRAGPAIFASALTVIAALLTLSLAEVNGTAGLGPIGAMGVTLAMVSMLTLLPALLVLTGRRAFWPFVPRYGTTGADETHGAWRRIGERVAARPRLVAALATAGLLALAAGNLGLDTGLTSGNGFRDDPESAQGQRLLQAAFPAGANAPTVVVVRDPSRLAAVREAARRQPGVSDVGPVERGAPGARFDVTLHADPYSRRAFDAIVPLRRTLRAAGGEGVLVGGPTAEERDYRESAGRDNRLIVPLALLVVLLILGALLRAVVAAVLLVATVIASFAAALGTGVLVFEHVFDFPGVDPALPLFAFIFLVALGVDYNIFLMARVREEAQRHGSREGLLRGVAVTGGVITSAGIVLAGTFSTLAVLPLVALTEIGFIIAFGVLLDTFIVRSVLVPALGFELGARLWWPSALARERAEGRAEARPAAGPGSAAAPTERVPGRDA